MTDTTVNNTDYPVNNLVQKRWSPRSFADKPVKPKLLRQLFEAARWAPSSFNVQPWRFIVATKKQKEQYKNILSVLNQGNQRWAKEAPVLILTVLKSTFSRNGNHNRAAKHDLGQAVAYFTMEATRNNLYLHQMAGINLHKAQRNFKIPEEYETFTAIALGFPGKAEPPSNRNRKDLDEIVFQGDWENREPI